MLRTVGIIRYYNVLSASRLTFLRQSNVKNTIAFVHSVPEIGGAERMSEALIDGLINHEHYTPLLIIPSAGPFGELVKNKGCDVIETPLPQPEFNSPYSTIRHAFKLSKKLKKAHIKLLQCADLVCARAILPAAKFAGIPVICHMHFPVKPDYVAWTFRRMSKPVGFVYCSSELKEATSSSLSKACPKAFHQVIHNGVDIDKFNPVEAHNTTPRIGIVANLQERKGHIDFLDMAKLVTDAGYNAEFDIIGGDILQAPRQQVLENYTAQLGLTDKVTFHGQIDNVLAVLSALDILICASHQEAFPVSILEAMAMQKPIVSTNVNGIVEQIVSGESGLLVDAKAPEQLAKAVQQLLDDPALAAQLASNARDRVVANFSHASYVSKFCDLYQSI